ncbi:YjiH family protein [Bacillus weihaiensis]|uniref:Nucleoside transporter/FeoB GTPase Gate domain-containing protein n=1 Tax=Bacillus weihaiensis TaxID=1547283 RepID=A0A1L3MTL1_9BACI|nr:YjiH family protein [Bacillus weihaiensis]APH05688.1 hypothetical protein A9C19_13540 [Bacillus weihaiensis]
MYTLKHYLTFIIPSFIGIFLFIIPVSINGEFTISVAWLASKLQDILGDSIPFIATSIIGLSAIFSLIAGIAKPTFMLNSALMKKLFFVSWIWQIARVVGFLFSCMVLFQVGPSSVWNENTGGLLLFDLIPVLFTIFIFAGLFLPLLLDFGLLEICGAMFTKIMRPLFTLPGRSSIDCLASWLGDGTVGVLLTNKQYEDGFYTKREAAVIGTTFSVVSITFTIVIMEYLELEKYFGAFYLTIVVAGLACALILPRIPPLSRKADTYHNQKDKKEEEKSDSISLFKWGVNRAVKQASDKRFSDVVKGGVENVLDLWLGVLPIVMTIGTIALVIAEYTPLFKLLGAPFIPVLEMLQVPEAAEASQTMLIGFADMFLPAIIGSGIESEMTRFIIGCLSITQLIYMSEVGGLLLGSKVPVTFLDLVLIFLLRTVISIPIIIGIAHVVF